MGESRVKVTVHQIRHAVITLILMCCGSAALLEDQNDRGEDTALLEAVWAALEKVTKYLEEDYSVINVDGLFGARLCQGSLVGSLNDCSGTELHCPKELTDKLQDINDRLSNLAVHALPYIKQEDEDYFTNLEKMIDQPYIIQYIPENLHKPVKDNGSDTNYDYEFGMTCFSLLMGTYRYEGRTQPACIVAEKCWQYMTRNDTSQYFTSHQVLFFIVAEQSGCLDKLEALAVRDGFVSVRDVQRSLCGQIYLQALWQEEGGKLPISFEDLFLEQTVLCGVLGFQNFFLRKWIRMVLSWQTPVGCFTEPPSMVALERVVYDLKQEYIALRKELSEADDKMDKDRRNFLIAQKKTVMETLVRLTTVKGIEAFKIDLERGVRVGRALLMEKVMSGDCLAHKTGLAVGTLGVYLRHLIRQLFFTRINQ